MYIIIEQVSCNYFSLVTLVWLTPAILDQINNTSQLKSRFLQQFTHPSTPNHNTFIYNHGHPQYYSPSPNWPISSNSTLPT